MNTNRKNTVVILGTGATIGSGYTRCGQNLPGDRGFFGDPMVQKRLSDYPALDVMLDSFRRMYGGDLAKVGLEEVCTFLEFCSIGPYKDLHDLSDEKQKWLGRIRISNRNDEHCLCKKFRADNRIPPDLESIDMSLLIGWDLKCLLSETYHGISSPGTPTNYKKLMDTYEIPQALPTVFISLNYDTVLEHALKDAGLPWYYAHIPTAIERDPGGIEIIKPHGSLNWLFEGNEPQVSISTDYGLEPVANRCSEVNRFEEAMIIPPTQLKGALNIPETQATLTIHLFGKIWKRAADVLVSADRVFTIGYSFPSTDHHFRTLLQLVNTKRERKNYDEVYCCTLASGDEKADKDQNGVFESAKLFFPSQNFYHYDQGFGQFAADTRNG